MEGDEHGGFWCGVEDASLVHIAGQDRIIAITMRAPCLPSAFPVPGNAKIVRQLAVPESKDALADCLGLPLTTPAKFDVVRTGCFKPRHYFPCPVFSSRSTKVAEA